MIFETCIANYYGSVSVKEEDGKYFVGLEDYHGGYNWKECTSVLFFELLRLALERAEEEAEDNKTLISQNKEKKDCTLEFMEYLINEQKEWENVIKEIHKKMHKNIKEAANTSLGVE